MRAIAKLLETIEAHYHVETILRGEVAEARREVNQIEQLLVHIETNYSGTDARILELARAVKPKL